MPPPISTLSQPSFPASSAPVRRGLGPLGPGDGGRIVAHREIPAREAVTVPFPAELPESLAACLRERGIDQLYSHQADMYARARAGQDVVITTSTASGKSLGFLLPVLQAVLEDPAARVLLLYPTKALAHDQLRSLLELSRDLTQGGRPLQMGVYDGDTPPVERRRLREHANLVLTNPDMLHAGLLPAHGRPGFSHLFRHVRYVVIDELHVYRGAFGAHFANVMRRLQRVCEHYSGSAPQLLASSATIANPDELARRLCQRELQVVAEDGSPSPGKRIEFWQPPLLENGTRRAADREVAALLPELIRARKKTIAFCRSRKETEVVLRESQDRLRDVDGGHDETALLAAYRGGYTPEERRQIERDLHSGQLMAVVSTNALELGVDVGQLEVVVQAGFPGTRASFWQQLGRAGRRGDQSARGILVLAARPTDQFLANHPGWLVDQAAEHAVVDPDNLTVQLAHVRAAAAELPLSLDDVRWFADLGEILPVLAEAGEVREVYGSWHWSGPAFPAGDMSLRATDGDRFKVVDRRTEAVLTEMTRPQVYREAHPRAVYLHQGVEYLVEELDLVSHRALVIPVEQNYYTQPDVRTAIEVLLSQEQQELGRTRAWFGDVRVEDTVVGYKMLEFHNHQNLGYEELHEPLRTRLETEAVWLAVPEEVLEVLGQRPDDALQGMVHALRAVASLVTMAERSDLLGTSFRYAPAPESDRDQGEAKQRTAVVLYDHHPGGIGFAAKAHERLEGIVQGALELVRDCSCASGCPACVGDYSLPRALIAWGLERLLREVPLPPGLGATPASPRPGPQGERPPATEPAIPWDDVAARWGEVRQRLVAQGGAGAAFLGEVEQVRTGPKTLVLELASPGLVAWLGERGARRQLKRRLAGLVAVPNGWRLSAEVDEAGRRRGEATRLRLRRRHQDLTRPAAPEASTPEERLANEQLGSGWVPRQGSPRS